MNDFDKIKRELIELLSSDTRVIAYRSTKKLLTTNVELQRLFLEKQDIQKEIVQAKNFDKATHLQILKERLDKTDACISGNIIYETYIENKVELDSLVQEIEKIGFAYND